MPTFRKKPVEVEAHRLPADTYEVEDASDLSVFMEMPDVKLFYVGSNRIFDYAEVQTEEGPLRAQPGDWIITGVEGERYPCKDRIFRATYEKADAPSATEEPPATEEEVEAYIRSLDWSEGSTDYQRTLVAGNIRSFWHWLMGREEATEPTPLQRLLRARREIEEAADCFRQTGNHVAANTLTADCTSDIDAAIRRAT